MANKENSLVHTKWMCKYHIVFTLKVLNKDHKVIGMSSVPDYGDYFRKILTLTVTDIEYSEPGTEVHVVWETQVHVKKRSMLL